MTMRDGQLSGGGMLLEPPGHRQTTPESEEGFFVLSLKGTGLSMNYPYRPVAGGEFVVGADPVVARGRRDGDAVLLDLFASTVLKDAVQLRLVPAPDTPIPPGWRDSLYSDGILFGVPGPVRWYHRLLFGFLRASWAVGRPWRRRVARRRLARAWRAAA